jgi:hypothetical protein
VEHAARMVGNSDKLECIWDDNIKMNLKEIQHEYVHNIHLLQYRIQSGGLCEHIMNFHIPCKAGNLFNN